MFGQTRLSAALAAALLAISASASDTNTTPGDRQEPSHDVDGDRQELRIAPVSGLTTAWHRAPEATAIPLGTVVTFQATMGSANSIDWRGATPVLGSDPPLARYICAAPGRHDVVATMFRPDGTMTECVCTLEVIDIRPRDIAVTARLTAPPTPIDEIEPGQSPNEAAVAAWFGGSIARLTELGDDRFRTSNGRKLVVEVEVEPAGFLPLIETRLDGGARFTGNNVPLRFHSVGAHQIDVGPLDAAHLFDVETYAVEIISHEQGDPIEDGVTTVYVAQTNPRGFEHEIRWLAATKYGRGTPMLGEGAVFVTTFEDTWGELDGEFGWEQQWLGVRADHAVLGQDGKTAVCELIFEGDIDCNDNGVPDRCESDCNIANGNDFLEVLDGRSPDLDGNWIPDDCDPDCDGDGIPDAAETDSDGDGTPDDCELPTNVTPMPPGPHLFSSDFDGFEVREYGIYEHYRPAHATEISSNGNQPGDWFVFRSQNDHPDDCFNDVCACEHHVGNPRIHLEDGRLTYAGSLGNFSSSITIAHCLGNAGDVWTMELLFFPSAPNDRSQFSVASGSPIPHDNVPADFGANFADRTFRVNDAEIDTGMDLDPANPYRMRFINTPAGITGELFDDVTGDLLATVDATASPCLKNIMLGSGNYVTQQRTVEWIVIDGVEDVCDCDSF